MGSLFTAFTRELPIVALILPSNELSPCVGLNPGKDFEPGPNDFEAELLRSRGTNSAIALLDPTVSENTWYVKILKYLLCTFVIFLLNSYYLTWSKCKSCCSSEDVKHATDYIISLCKMAVISVFIGPQYKVCKGVRAHLWEYLASPS